MTALTKHEALLNRVATLIAEDAIRNMIDETANLVEFLTEVNKDVITENKEGLDKAQSQLKAFQSDEFKTAVINIAVESYFEVSEEHLAMMIQQLELSRAVAKGNMAVSLRLPKLCDAFVEGVYNKPTIH